jgi:hypothetical protein
MAFLPGNGPLANALRAAFQNSDPDPLHTKGGQDINIRVLSDDLYTIREPFPLSQQLRLPLRCNDVAGEGEVNTQESPSITRIGSDLTGIAYASDESVGGNFDVWLVVHSADGCKELCDPVGPDHAACVARDTPVKLSLPGSAPGSRDPDIAGGPEDAALAVWTRGSQVLGRIWQTTGALVPNMTEIPIAQNGSHARVAGTATGWVVVYQGSGNGDGDGIFKRAVDPGGGIVDEVKVNSRVDGLQEQPDVAALPDGRTIVVWRSDGDIYFQRHDAAGAAIAGDQDAPLNTTTDGDQWSPAVADAGVLGDFFAVAWEHAPTGEIFARFPSAGGGFLYNSVTGQNADFLASRPGIEGASRRLPAVAVGGAGYVAIGWQDDSDGHPGVYVRRFPLPSQ